MLVTYSGLQTKNPRLLLILGGKDERWKKEEPGDDHFLTISPSQCAAVCKVKKTVVAKKRRRRRSCCYYTSDLTLIAVHFTFLHINLTVVQIIS